MSLYKWWLTEVNRSLDTRSALIRTVWKEREQYFGYIDSRPRYMIVEKKRPIGRFDTSSSMITCKTSPVYYSAKS